MTEKVNQNNNDGNKSVRGITNLIIVQVITKLFTFVLNQLIIRYLTQRLLVSLRIWISFIQLFYSFLENHLDYQFSELKMIKEVMQIKKWLILDVWV